MASLPNIRRHARRSSPSALVAPERDRPDVQRLEAHGLTWLIIEEPTEAETAWLAEHQDFHPLDLEDVLSRRRQRSKIDEYDDYVFLVLHFPRFDKRTGRLQATELNVFIGPGLLIIIPKDPLKPISALWSRCEQRDDARHDYMSKGSGFLLYEIVDQMFDYCFPILDKIGFKLDTLEDAIFEGQSHELVRDISTVKQEIINYRKIIKPQRPTLRMLERAVQRYAPDDLEIYFDDIVDKNERIWDSLENYKEVADALEATNESVITHRLNEMLALLTIISAVILPLTLITGFYGMNIDGLPFARNGLASFIVLVVVMVALAGGVLWYFRRRKWL
ncbi:MAG: magnesium transporter CorA family protein [Actinobacteria bacterium]|nr:magnesium transporter CorA family protein [Actinomycetota bacterium]MBM3697031.1 magnesium transporter CorA family protein [Actinomycetota bacterium]